MVIQNINYLDYKNCNFKNAYKKIKKAKNILIWGDEDPDGITATSIMYLTLKGMKKKVNYFIPSRKRHGIGLNIKVLKEFIKEVDLIITVDCGSVNYDEIKFLINNNVGVIITDHHIPYKKRVNKAVYINTHLLKNKKFLHLSGAGLSLIVSIYIKKQYEKALRYKDIIDKMEYEFTLAAMGTLCDKVKIEGFNKYIITYLNNIEMYFPLDNRDNIICGIIYQSKTYKYKNKLVDIFSKNIKNKNIINRTINTYRKKAKDNINEIDRIYKRELKKIDKDKSVILHLNKNLNFSQIGVIASKISETINKPVCIISKKGKVFIGEARTNNTFNWQKTLKRFEKYFVNWGGHKPAAGFTITGEKLYDFINDFNNVFN